MKFSHGAWEWAKNVIPTPVHRVNEYRIEKESLWMSVLDRHGKEGADKFLGLVLEVKITSPMPDVVRVQVRHFHPSDTGRVKPDLDYSLRNPHVKIQDFQDEILFITGKVTLRIRKSNWEMRFEEAGRQITAAAGDCLGYMQVADRGPFIMQRLQLAVGECIYGLGERFGPLVKNGQTVTMWNEDGGTVSDLAYKNIPFCLSSRGYGVLVNTPAKVEFEVATERVMQLQFSVPGEELDYYLFYGPDPKDVLEKYTRLSGRAAIPPAWSFGLWLSTSFTTKYDEKTVNEFVDGMFKRGIPLQVVHFDSFWMRERHWCDFQWDTAGFPDPPAMLKRLKAKGLKVCLWINPYISQLSSMFAEGRDNGYLLKRADGSVFQRDQWQCGMGLVDFTNPDSAKWYTGKLRNLLEMGADCFKTDFGEFIPEDVVYFDGSDPALMHNHYTHLYNKAVFELLEDYHGKGAALVFARSATIGGQKFPVHWGGDCEAKFESMYEDLRGGLSFCMSGAAFWSHDMGGFNGKADPALYKRWAAFGLLSTHSRLHGAESYRVPWLFDEESVDVMRHFARLKCRLFPYLFAAAHDAHERGWPVMRAMPLEFPGDPACLYLDRQYMLGSSLLVAPIFRQDNIAEYYLPEGKWTRLLSGEVVAGGRWFSETMDFFNVPLFARENSIVPTSGNEEQPQWNLRDELTLHLFQIGQGAEIVLRLVGADGQTRITCTRHNDKITLKGDGKAKNVRVLLHGVAKVSSLVNGKPLTHRGDGELLQWTNTVRAMAIVPQT